MAQTTWTGIVEHWPWGSGLGSFVDLYPRYDTSEHVSPFFTNHAHNDFLELLLEGGIYFAVLFVFYLAVLLLNIPDTPLKRAALLAILALLAHSLVDYPLRTLGLATIFAVLNGIYFHKPHGGQSATK